MSTWPVIEATLRQGNCCQLITITAARGSTPRELGACMVVMQDTIAGTIGGGELELQAISYARSQLINETPDVTHRQFSLGPDLGQCCGGHVELRFEGFDPSRLIEIESLAAAEQNGEFKTVSVESNGLIHRTIVKETDGADHGGSALLETFGVKLTDLAIFGAGHVAKALMLSLAPLPFNVTLIDSRCNALPDVTPRNFACVAEPEPPQAIKALPNRSQILVMTHNHKLDLNIVAAALEDARFSFLGLIGSKTKHKRFLSQLRTLGFPKTELEKIKCPIGIGGIKSKTPACIAVSVTAELLVEREKDRRS